MKEPQTEEARPGSNERQGSLGQRTMHRVPFMRRIPLRFVLMILGPLILAVIGAYYYITGGRFVETENAYVKADKIAVSTDVPGRVVEVGVQENDLVKPGQFLFKLDQEPFRIALEYAEAELERVKNEVRTLSAVYKNIVVELEAAEQDVSVFNDELKRRTKLMERGVVNQDRFDTAARNLEQARGRVVVIRQELARILAQLGGVTDLPPEQHPLVLEAKSMRDKAQLDFRNTVVTAPTGGIVTKHDLQAGEYVRAGAPIFSIVSWKDLWIEANLKETQLTHVYDGQKATIHVDAYPNQVWKAVVKGIAPATGAEFSILPPQNATGNWVKVVQRVPVRLELTESPAGPPLRAGMSVIVEIDTGQERELPGFISSALAFVKGE